MDFHNQQVVIIAYSISNLVALIMLWLSWKKPLAGRILFFLVFLWAGWVNSKTAMNEPALYQDYANYALLPFYKKFITGFFRIHTTIIVTAIAICQFAISLSMFLKGIVFKAGCIGGIIFLISITPLGTGSGFPATLTMAIAMWLLLKNSGDKYLWQSFKRQEYP